MLLLSRSFSWFVLMFVSVMMLLSHPDVLHSQGCVGGQPVIFDVQSSDGTAAGCLRAGTGSRITIKGCNLQDVEIFIVPNGRPEEAAPQTNFDPERPRTSSEITLIAGRILENSTLEIRRTINGVLFRDSRCVGPTVGASTFDIYDFDPKIIPANRPTLVYIYGGGLRSRETEISINNVRQDIVYRAQSIDNTTNPPRALDTIVVEVVNCISGPITARNTISNRSVTTQGVITCVQPTAPAPIITDFGPRRGGSGTEVTIAGANLDQVTRVRFGVTEGVILDRTATSLRVRVQSGSSGRIELSSPNGSVRSVDNFEFVRAPVINEVSPLFIGPNTPVVIYGSNLRDANVFFGASGGPALTGTNIRVNSDGTELTLTMGTIGTITNIFPILPQFNVPVRVQTPGGVATARQTMQIITNEFSIPRLSLRPANARNGARIQDARLSLRERIASFFPPQSPQGGEILVERRGWHSNLNVIVNLTYRDSSGNVLSAARGFFAPKPNGAQGDVLTLPISPLAPGENPALLPRFPQRNEDPINGLRGDLGGSARTRGTDSLLPGNNAVPLPITTDIFSEYDSVSMSFQARWSDQSYITNLDALPQSPALQGRRTLTLELVDPINPNTYQVDVLNRTATVVLDDPDPTNAVRVVSPIPNKMIAPGANDIIELELPGNVPNPLNSGNYLPRAVFLDETYSALQYTAQASDTALIRNLRIEQFQTMPNNRMRLLYQLSSAARSGSSAMITVTASNGRGGSTTHTFSVSVLQGAPIIDRIEPSAAAPGTTVTIRGRDLANLRSVAFTGTTTSANAEIISTSADVIVVRVPNTAQTGAITVTTRVAASQTQVFTVIRTPQIQGFSPETGTTGTLVEIRGVNFSGVNAVSFGGVSALDFAVIADTLIRARVRNGASGAITLANMRESVVSGGVFTVIPPPIITNVSPQLGGAETEVTLTGENFTGAGFTSPDTVLMNNIPVRFTLQGASSLTFRVPNFGLFPLNSLPIRMITRGGSTTSTLSFNFTPCPRLETVVPETAGPLDSISIFGTNLNGVTAVRIGGVPVWDFRAVSPTELRVAVGSVNTGRVVVITPICSDSSARNFTYTAPARPLLITFPRFGKLFPNDASTATATLMNLSAAAMTLTPSIQGDTEANFSIVQPTQALTLQRNGVAQVTVRFAPKTSGIKTARLSVSGQGLAMPQDTAMTEQAGVWQILPTAFDTVRIGRNTVRAVRVINRNTTPSRIDAVRVVGDSRFSIIGVMPRWIGAGDTVAVIVRSSPNAQGRMQAGLAVETAGADSGRGEITAFAREQRSTDIVVEPSFVAERDSVEAGQNVALRLNLRITQNATRLPAMPLVRGSVRWNRNVLHPQLNPNGGTPQAQGTVRIVRNTETRNPHFRAEIPLQTAHQSWTGTTSPLLISLPLGVYYGETNISPLEIEELRVGELRAGEQGNLPLVFVEEPQNSVFTARTFGRQVRSRTNSSLDVVSPSPTTAAANVRYTIASETAILLTLVDSQGKRIKTITEGWREKGVYEHTFDVSELPSGSYYIMLHTERERVTAQLRVVR